MMPLPDVALSVPDLLYARARHTPALPAYVREVAPGEWQAVNWMEHWQEVQRLAGGLSALGLRPGDRVGLCAPTSLTWETLHHAVLALGGVVVGLDPHDLPERLQEIARIAGITVVLAQNAAMVDKLGSAVTAGCHLVVQFDDGAAGPSIRLLRDVPQATAALPEDRVEVRPDDTATIIFTSGTSGAPKGIAYSHAQLLLACRTIVEAFPFVDEHSRLLCWLPLSNLFQRIVNLSAIARGSVTWLLDDPRRVMEVVRLAEPDVFIGVPRFFEKLVAGIRDNVASLPARQQALFDWARRTGHRYTGRLRHGHAVPLWLAIQHQLAERLVLRRLRGVMGRRLRCMVTGSAPTPRWMLEELHALGWLVLEAYGLSENVVPMALNRIDSFRFGTVGQVVDLNHIKLAEDGEILVAGPGVFSGYVGDDASSRQLAAQEGFHASGDFGRFDEDGFLHLLGRKSDLIKTSTGRRIAPAGVEALLSKAQGVEQVMLVGAGRKCPVALLTTAELPEGAQARSLLESRVRAAVETVPEHERPAAVAVIAPVFSIEHGELTANLKLRRPAIEARYAALIEHLYAMLELQPVELLPILYERAHAP
jgi:long-chain acyl-CoA synthetase